ncbi:hypothetical protein F4604DRAFT_1677364 [Suillus subluteus]|nr:hypothetical protein F4604DRAFT_1677364 [Suillus subluteus]
MPDPEVSYSLEDWRIRPMAVHFHDRGRKLIVAYLNHEFGISTLRIVFGKQVVQNCKLCRVLHHGQESAQNSYYPLTVSSTPDCDAIVGGSNSGEVCVWKAHTGDLLQVLDHRGNLIQAVVVCQGSGKWIAAGAACNKQDPYIAIWAADTSVGSRPSARHISQNPNVTYKPDLNQRVKTSKNKSLCIGFLHNTRPLRVVLPPQILSTDA